MQLYFVRHGETEWNKEHRYYGKTDLPLNSKGEEQGKRIGALLKDISFDMIYTSPLKRAIQTKQFIINENHKKEVKELQSMCLSEQDLGIFEGYTYGEIEQKFPNELQQWNQDFKSAPHGGESFYDFYDRIYHFCTEILEVEGLAYRGTEKRNIVELGQRLQVPKKRENEKVLIVSHMAVLRCIFTMLLGMQEDAVWNFTIEQGTYSRIDIEDGYAIVKKINQS